MRHCVWLLLFIVFPLVGQIEPATNPQQLWLDQTLITINENDRNINIQTPSKQNKSVDVLLPANTLFQTAMDGHLYCTTRNKGQKTTTLWKSPVLRPAWEIKATMKFSEGEPAWILPLENGTMLLVNPLGPFKKQKVASNVAIGRLNEKSEIELYDLVDLGFSYREWKHTGVDSTQKTNNFELKKEFQYLLGMISTPPIPLKSHYLLILGNVGHLYLFSKENGTLKRKSEIFKSIDEKTLTKSETIEHVVLGIQPLRDGKCLIASRSEDAALNARQIFPGKSWTGNLGKEPEKQIQEHKSGNNLNNKNSLEAFSEILWWYYYPETGDFARISVPKGAPNKIFDPGIMESFRFKITFSNQIQVF